MTSIEFKAARKKFVSNVGPGAFAMIFGLYNFGDAAFPHDTNTNPALWARLVRALAGLVFALMSVYWFRKAFSQKRYLECPACKVWLAGYGRDKLLRTGKCPKCGTQIIADVNEHAA